VNVNAAGVEDEVVSHMIDCPPHLIGLLIGRGGSTIKRIKEESRANVVINQKMMKVCVHTIYTMHTYVLYLILRLLWYSCICIHACTARAADHCLLFICMPASAVRELVRVLYKRYCHCHLLLSYIF
jgi:KH domain